MNTLPVLAVCLAVLTVPPALHAVLIQHNGTNVFEEDFEEGYGPGFGDPRDMYQDVTPTVPASLNRVASTPVVPGARGNHTSPFAGTIDNVKIFAEGDPPIPKVGTVISVR
jgi:hypothetical protein